MSTVLERCRLKHKYRGNENYCKLCGESLKWIKNRLEDFWVPVDAEPVIYEANTDGKYIVYDSHNKQVPFARVYFGKGILPSKPKQGHIPHYYTCPVLRKERSDWYRAKMERMKHDTQR